MASLEQIAALPDQKQKIEQYRQVLEGTIASGSAIECKCFVNHSESWIFVSKPRPFQEASTSKEKRCCSGLRCCAPGRQSPAAILLLPGHIQAEPASTQGSCHTVRASAAAL